MMSNILPQERKRQKRTVIEDHASRVSGDSDLHKPSQPAQKQPSQSNALRLACPYHKRYPSKYRGACADPGFPTVHRLIQHLLKKHYRGKDYARCERCKTSFRQTEISAHLALTQACEPRAHPVDYEDGFDLAQMARLKSRELKPKNFTLDRDRWRKAEGTQRWQVPTSTLASTSLSSTSNTGYPAPSQGGGLGRGWESVHSGTDGRESGVQTRMVANPAGVGSSAYADAYSQPSWPAATSVESTAFEFVRPHFNMIRHGETSIDTGVARDEQQLGFLFNPLFQLHRTGDDYRVAYMGSDSLGEGDLL
ncbi:hypothetical protein B0H63DRAFT_537843 [Podospora didyma]|uniref:C2H2-type domain-containing protein n=1 Tax=Podospora didyma TaxID=330526 RepID=A0AAE0U3Z8_9PEZI|nr:hypothetical protein B0H63DRAFT_537843 [Podospora didyma]